jgi:hypothetical protein
MNVQEKMAMIRQRRLRASLEAQKLAKQAGLNDEQTKIYLFEVDSNAIWDGEANMPYSPPKAPTPDKNIEPTPMYSEKAFCESYIKK